MDINLVSTHLGSFGFTLAADEHSGLEVAMLERAGAEKLPSPLQFWGRVAGKSNDYLVCVATASGYGFPKRSFYYCTRDSFTLKQLPPPDKYAEKAKAVTGLFSGDPSFPLEPEPEDAPEAEEGAPPPESFREIHRLSYVVDVIDKDTAVAPVNSWTANASKSVVANKSYAGLSHAAAAELRNYYHFRAPQTALCVAAMEKPGLARPSDIFDPISADKPAGAWTVRHNEEGTRAELRSLYWPGFFFVQDVGGPGYGGVYFGNGLPNQDLAFAL
ncbi:hypothetical protein TeGR_g12974 [Tetraparma gracilis]|uniref:Radial spoke head protein 9 homolog n=1 Tax=Tetraparma gracilis TaxID=2962635 RepID=A0ABQ6N559_9STRA|nr:hypothetical protein TeGR_g12974 [Tetraparma gracilis]